MPQLRGPARQRAATCGGGQIDRLAGREAGVAARRKQRRLAGRQQATAQRDRGRQARGQQRRPGSAARRQTCCRRPAGRPASAGAGARRRPAARPGRTGRVARRSCRRGAPRSVRAAGAAQCSTCAGQAARPCSSAAGVASPIRRRSIWPARTGSARASASAASCSSWPGAARASTHSGPASASGGQGGRPRLDAHQRVVVAQGRRPGALAAKAEPLPGQRGQLGRCKLQLDLQAPARARAKSSAPQQQIAQRWREQRPAERPAGVGRVWQRLWGGGPAARPDPPAARAAQARPSPRRRRSSPAAV